MGRGRRTERFRGSRGTRAVDEATTMGAEEAVKPTHRPRGQGFWVGLAICVLGVGIFLLSLFAATLRLLALYSPGFCTRIPSCFVGGWAALGVTFLVGGPILAIAGFVVSRTFGYRLLLIPVR